MSKSLSPRRERQIDKACGFLLPMPVVQIVASYVPYPQTKGQYKRMCRQSHRKLSREVTTYEEWKDLFEASFNRRSPSRILYFSRCIFDMREQSDGRGGEFVSWRFVGQDEKQPKNTFGYREGSMSYLTNFIHSDHAYPEHGWLERLESTWGEPVLAILFPRSVWKRICFREGALWLFSFEEMNRVKYNSGFVKNSL